MWYGQLRKPLAFAFFALLLAVSFGVKSKGITLVSAAPERSVEDNIIVSKNDPVIAMKVDQSFRYLGEHPIRIRDVAAGERLVFADMEGSKAHRLLIIQFEGFLPGVDDEYRYNLNSSPIVAGYPFRSNAYAFDFAKSAKENPGLESAATAKFLSSQGITAPQQLVMWRSLTVASSDKRKEMIIYYLEDLAAFNMALDDIYDPITDKDTPAWNAFQTELERRANASFSLTELDEYKRPKQASWQHIPLLLTQ